MSRHYNWGIIGTGLISNLFTEDLNLLSNARIQGVGSRSPETAKSFADKWNIPKAYSNYSDLFSDESIDIVYIGTPHNFHFQNTLDALNAGKHVLCEKPMTINANQARELVRCARNNNLFLMDAMWTRFQPWYSQVRTILNDGVLGDILHLKADLSFKFDVGSEHRIFNRDLAGGSLLDLGVYPIAFTSAFLGKPVEIQTSCHLHETGVDDQVQMIFKYAKGVTADLGCSSLYFTKNNATLHGAKGYLEIHGMFHRPDKITIYPNNRPSQEIETPYTGNAYHYEAQAVMDMLDKGELEHPLMPLDETIEIIETMDLIRSRAGITYPDE